MFPPMIRRQRLSLMHLNLYLPPAFSVPRSGYSDNKSVRTMRITPMAAGFIVISSAVGLTIAMPLLAPQLTALQAAEATNAGGSVTPVSAEAADQTGLKTGTIAIETKSPADGSKQRLATAKLE